MNPRRVYKDYLEDILEAAALTMTFLDGISYEAFCGNIEKVFAVTRALEVIGEAAAHIPEDIQKRRPDIPWSDMIGMRNILIHGYFQVDFETLWRTAKEDIPPLKAAIEELIAMVDDD